MSFSPIPSYIFGSMFTGLGLVSLAAPKLDYQLFGLPLEAAPASGSTSKPDGAVSPVMYAKGVRDLAFGLTYFALEYTGLPEAVTVFSAVLCTVALGDGFIVWKHGGTEYQNKAFGHWSGLATFAAWVAWRVQSS
ncbi:integral membrane protein [Ophiostoma piceae UAMH 11346]|uniref:Integral membrane protein n=1 Tax=Ophiostoma piceae (strain UAMH 11346) TaxID=1262450 RepID=S3C647_OPHP1|nr:integral membrane protein [Ophiostoma piceae UAMH 11346]